MQPVSIQQRTNSFFILCPVKTLIIVYCISAPVSQVETRQLGKSFSVIFGNKISLYDFRHAFVTRAQECGVPENEVQDWVGHSQKTLTGKTYTHFSDKYMIEQSKIIDY